MELKTLSYFTQSQWYISESKKEHLAKETQKYTTI